MYTHPPLHTSSHQQTYFDYWPEVIYQQKVLAKPTNSSISTKVADDLFTLLTSTEWPLVHGGFRWTSHCTSRRRKRGVAQRAIKIWNTALGGAWSPILLWISKMYSSLLCWEIVAGKRTHVAETEGNHSTGHSERISASFEHYSSTY